MHTRRSSRAEDQQPQHWTISSLGRISPLPYRRYRGKKKRQRVNQPSAVHSTNPASHIVRARRGGCSGLRHGSPAGQGRIKWLKACGNVRHIPNRRPNCQGFCSPALDLDRVPHDWGVSYYFPNISKTANPSVGKPATWSSARSSPAPECCHDALPLTP
ncbi:hypothetical protein LZ30DRAFT_75082 [Colletotrichum cereale]|nr:hypothetical protein LZ30DRAFT_75082 [Colletotrichum cereale]